MTQRFDLAYNLVIFAILLTVGGLLYIVLNGPMDAMLDAASSQGTSEYSSTGIGWTRQFVNAIPIFLVVIGLAQLIIAAIRESDPI
jgi:site-specific recombinase